MNVNPPPLIVPEYSTFGTLSRQAVGDKDDATTGQALPPIDETPEEERPENLPRDEKLLNKEKKSGSSYAQILQEREGRRESGREELAQAAQHNNARYQLETIQNQWFEQDKGRAIDKSI